MIFCDVVSYQHKQNQTFPTYHKSNTTITTLLVYDGVMFGSLSHFKVIPFCDITRITYPSSQYPKHFATCGRSLVWHGLNPWPFLLKIMKIRSSIRGNNSITNQFPLVSSFNQSFNLYDIHFLSFYMFHMSENCCLIAS